MFPETKSRETSGLEDTFDFSQGHVTKNQPMAVPV